MMITTVVKVHVDELISKVAPEYVKVTNDADGHLQALSWLYETKDRELYHMAKKRGGVWNPAVGWTFGNPSIAQDFLDTIVKRNPGWMIIGHPDKPFLPLDRIRISRLSLENGFGACLVPVPLPYFSRISGAQRVFKIGGGKKRGDVGLLIGRDDDIAAAVDSMTKQGAICDNTMAKKWAFATNAKKLKVKVNGWSVQVECDFSSLLHYLIAPEAKYRWTGSYPFGTRVTVPWAGTIYTTRKLWPALKSRIIETGLEWEGDDPEAELSVPAAFNVDLVEGWATPAPNGHLLHAYQKEGAEFCARRGMRALIGDEMGVGKTVQAIAAAEATSAPRVVIICPANARYVWDREIQGWGGRGKIQHITNQLDALDPGARWHIITYDLIVSKTETWRLNDAQEVSAFSAACPHHLVKPGQSFPIKVPLSKAVATVPAFTDKKRIAAWEKAMQRLRGELLEQILAAGPMLVILDEAHRVKNKDAKRTKAIQRIATGEAQMLMLTGTPLRNNEHEAAVLLGLLDDQADTVLSKENGYSIQDVKDYLAYFMIRRTKAEVLPELPEKTRQRIDISDLDPDRMMAYLQAMDWAHQSYDQALMDGKSEAEARQSMRGGIELARTALGLAKVLGGGVSELVLDVVESKGCCVVFCAHHQVSDSLKVQLEREKLQVAVIDGRTSQKDRAARVKEFQDGRLDVLIGGINAAGEAITLTRADTVIFVELDWVPAALLQAEDRIHRVGQRNNCQVIQLIARMQGVGDNLDEMMVDLIGSKLARIGAVLNEDTDNIISAGSIQAQLHERLLAEKGVTPVPAPKPAPGKNTSAQETEQEVPMPGTPAPSAGAEKRKRGRPKVYTDKAPPTATERSKQSIKALNDAGGKRVMLRLTHEAREALKVIMTITGSAQETAAINQSLIARKNELLRTSTQIIK